MLVCALLVNASATCGFLKKGSDCSLLLLRLEQGRLVLFIITQFVIMKTPNGMALFSLSLSKAAVSVFTWTELTFSAVLIPGG